MIDPKYTTILKSPVLSGMAKSVFAILADKQRKGCTPNQMAAELCVSVEHVLSGLRELAQFGLIRRLTAVEDGGKRNAGANETSKDLAV